MRAVTTSMAGLAKAAAAAAERLAERALSALFGPDGVFGGQAPVLQPVRVTARVRRPQRLSDR